MKNPIIFFFIVSLFIFVIDVYTFRGIKLLTADFSKSNNQIITWGYWLLTGMIIILGIVITFNMDYSTKHQSYAVPFYSFAILILYLLPKIVFIAFLLVEDIGFLAFWSVKKIVSSPSESGEIINRSTFFTQLGLGVATLQASALIYGIAKGRYNFRVVNQTLAFENLPQAFDGLKIVQISDVHIGSFFKNHEAVQKGVDLINSLNPDYVFFTGDMVNNYAWELEGWIDILSSIKAKYGKFSILGNHDYGDYVKWDSEPEKKKNLDDLKELQRKMGFRLLLNESVKIEQQGEFIRLIGMENWGAGGFSKYGKLDEAMKNSSDSEFQILLSHDPSHWDEEVIRKTTINLALAGHTHGMQFGVEIAGIKWSPSKYRYPRWGGLYEENKQYLYVNRGFGYIGFPGRVGIPPEITLLELRKKV